MLHRDEAIVIDTLKHKESSLIVKFYSKNNGMISIICHGVRKGKQNKMAYFTYLNLCEIIYSQKHNQSLAILKDIKTSKSLPFIRNQIDYSPMVLYISGLIKHTQIDFQENPSLFRWVWDYLQVVEENRLPINNIPLHFTINYLSQEGLLANPSESKILNEDQKAFFKSLIALNLNHDINNIASENLMDRKNCLSFILNHLSYNLQNNKIVELYRQIQDLYA